MRIGILSDIHEDYQSLRKALLIFERSGVDELACLGDIVGFNTQSYSYIDRRSPAKCIAAVRENCSIVVIGNHDLFALRKTPNHNAGFEFSNDWYSLDYEERKQRGNNQVWLYEETELSAMLSKKDYTYLMSLSEKAILETVNTKALFTHYLYPDLTGSKAKFIHESEDTNAHLEFMISNDMLLSFAGHGHIEGVLSISQKEISQLGFSTFILNSFPQAIITPAVAEGKKKNGIVVFDSEEMLIECIYL